MNTLAPNGPASAKPHPTMASTLLDLMRGGAAVLVLISHWRDLLFVPYGQSDHHGIWNSIFYLLTGAGHQAVVVFFVLSGYLITSSIVRSRAAGRWSWIDYLESRFARLWTVLIPALLLVCVLDLIGTHLGQSAPLYTGVHSEGFLLNAARGLTLPTFFGNIAFLQGIFVAPFGSDGALWSLSYEFWYYILFPLALIGIMGPSSWLIRGAHLLLFLVIARFVGLAIMFLFPIWLMGSALNYLPRAKPHPRLLAWLTPLYLLELVSRAPNHPALLPYVTGIATTVMIWLVLGLIGPASEAAWTTGSHFLAEFSYSLYVVHSPLLILMVGIWIGLERRQVSPGMILKASPLLLASCLLAYVFSLGTERHTAAVRRWFRLLHPGHSM